MSYIGVRNPPAPQLSIVASSTGRTRRELRLCSWEFSRLLHRSTTRVAFIVHIEDTETQQILTKQPNTSVALAEMANTPPQAYPVPNR